MAAVIANFGKRILYNEVYYKIVTAGISFEGEAYTELDPPNDELEKRLCDEIRKKGSFSVRLGRPNKITLGNDEYPYLR